MKLVALFSVLAIAASALHAQNPPERLKTQALSFGFNGSSQIGGKIWISKQEALTLRVGALTSSSTTEVNDTTDLDEDATQLNLNASVGIERHFDWGRDISPYLTGGGSVGYDMYNNSYGSVNFPYEYESSRVNLGLYAGIGVEYWLTHRISLAGQQVITGVYGFGKSSNGAPGTPADDVRSFTLGLGTSSLTLSMYW